MYLLQKSDLVMKSEPSLKRSGSGSENQKDLQIVGLSDQANSG